ncbi:MAG: hypothetical protein JST00_35745 [Deltaproteobacteria bacterium]|nr:hypothetical protein [Deltaproteobacteria bacterium]
MTSIGRVVRSALGVSFIGALVACSGGVSIVGADGGTSGSSGSSGSSGASSSGSSGASSSGGVACTMGTMDVARACVPGTAAAGVPLTIEAEGTDDGCLGCGKSLESCRVEIKGLTIKIGLDVKSCAIPPETPCAAICERALKKCTIPPLTAGAYAIELEGGVTTSLDFPRQLVVKQGATGTSCSISEVSDRPAIDATGFPDACTVDDDCALVTVGDVCQPCSCPNEAIATSGIEEFQSKFRAAQSLCKRNNDKPACAPCLAAKARCNANKCVVGAP